MGMTMRPPGPEGPGGGGRAPLIALRGVSKVYGAGETAVVALNGIDLTIERGDFVAVMGPSGSGKSTCMNVLGCLDTPSAGSYLFQGVDVGRLSNDQRALLRRHYTGFVFQGFNLMKRTSALENVELPLLYRGMKDSERRVRAVRALEQVGLADRQGHTSAELSGGQQQRVAIARAIVTDPVVLFADEPTGNLDSARSHEIMQLLSRLNRENGITVVMVTHEPDIAAYAKRRVLFRDARIVADEVQTPISGPQDLAAEAHP
jgi:putative ABC transport system ATP-binding protein